MMDRREFLGAAAAVPTIPRVADLGSADDDQTDDVPAYNQGVANTNIGSVASRFGTVERPNIVNAPTFDVGAVHYDDQEDSIVEVEVKVSDLRIGATLSPDQARGLARQLDEAARYAEEGSR